MVLLPLIVVEEKSCLSRAIAALFLAAGVASAGCSVDRAGLDPTGHVDANPDRAADRAHPIGGAAAGGAPGTGGTVGAGGLGGDTGAGGALGAGGAPDAGAADGDAAETTVVQAGSDAAAVDGPAGDRTGGDVPPDIAPDAAPDLGACAPAALCDSAVTVTLPGGRFTGTTSGMSTDQGSCGGDRAPEAAFRLVLTERSDVFVTTHGSGFDTVVYMRDGCCGGEVVCNDDADNRNTSMISPRGVPPGTYFIFVDGRNSQNQSGAFTVDIYATPASTMPADNCGSPVRIANRSISSSTCGMTDDFTPAGMAGCLVAPMTTSLDTVYYFVLDAPTTVTFSTCINTCIDTVLYIRDVCTSATVPNQRACNDNFCAPAANACPGGAQPVLSQARGMNLGAGVHYVVLDTHVLAGTGCGPFTLTPTGIPQ